MAKVSVVVPIYRVEQYLEQCVNSLLHQTLTDLEILLVNDASPDRSLEIARRFESDPRVRVIDKPHGGLGDTRNWGAREATGEYLAFVDSDDWLEEDAFERLAAAADADGADLTVFQFVRENVTDGMSRVCSLPIDPAAPREETARRVLAELIGPGPDSGAWRNVEMLGCAWRRLYRRDWFLQNRLSYYKEQEIMLEDLPVSIQAHALAGRVLFVDGAYYHYRYNPDSLSTRYRPGKMEMLLRCYEVVERFLASQGLQEEYGERHLAWLLRSGAHSALVNVFSPNNPASFTGRWKEVRGILRQPLVRKAAASGYLKACTKADRLIRLVIRTGMTLPAYVFYSAYSRSLRRDAGKK